MGTFHDQLGHFFIGVFIDNSADFTLCFTDDSTAN